MTACRTACNPLIYICLGLSQCHSGQARLIPLSANRALRWTAELIQRFADRWDWDVLSDNAALPWGLDLIERFADRWQPTAARHLRPLWERLQRQDIIDLMDQAPVPPVPSPDKLDDSDANKLLDGLF